ncbi:hypothetical protein [Actinosynnema sp. NPDC023587]|uniref:hypothetical protein n=1 Tax=Actinosynnema sp. NPDC023587 TaxID=3154695 RepID=UPI0033D41727
MAVELTGTYTRGRLVADLRPIVNTTHIESFITTDRHPVDVALTASADTFLARLLAALS